MKTKPKDAQNVNDGASPTFAGRATADRPIYFRHTADLSSYGLLKQYAKENRNDMTEAESALWRFLKGSFNGQKFRRQYIVGEYIVDFICLGKNLIIEVDGGYHSEPRQIEDDATRQQWLESQGFKILRLTNEEILFDTENSLNIIRQKLDLLPSLR